MTDHNLEELLYFNGLDGETGDYIVPPLSIKELAEVIQDDNDAYRLGRFKLSSGKSFALSPGLDAKDLSQTGWGIIFAQNDPQAKTIKAALKPLIDLRQAQASQKNETFFQIFEGPRGYRPGDKVQDFLNRLGVGEGSVDPEKGVPYYLLLAGSPEYIPFQFQFQLDVDFAVGRLHFDQIEAYHYYAQTLVAAEEGKIKQSRDISFFSVKDEGDRATESSAAYLIPPLEKIVQKNQDQGWTLNRFEGEGQATKAQLGQLLGGDQTPALLFTASHGMAYRPENISQAKQEDLQGALLCQGAYRNLQPANTFSGADLNPEAGLSGMIAFFFACFSAGTPQANEFQTIDDYLVKRGGAGMPAKLAERAFLAQLPQAMLGHPKGGALAVIGHVERAWQHSFMLSDFSAANTSNFDIVLRQLLKGQPVGEALNEFGLRFGSIATRLTDQLSDFKYYQQQREEYPDEYQEFIKEHGLNMVSLWTRHHDAKNYVLLGDPAVCLPLATVEESDNASSNLNLKTFQPEPETRKSETSSSPPDQPSTPDQADKPETSDTSYLPPLNPDEGTMTGDPELYKYWREHIRRGFEQNNQMFESILKGIMNPYYTTVWMYRAIFILGVISFLVTAGLAIWTEKTLFTLLFGGLSIGAFLSFFFRYPLQALEENLQFITWLGIIYNTYWARLMYLNDSKTVKDDLQEITQDAIKELDLLIDKHHKISHKRYKVPD